MTDAPTPAERLLYSLGQLYRLSRAGELDFEPAGFDALDLGRILGVRRDIEFVTDGPQGRSLHFVGEVLVIAADDEFPRRLLPTEEWTLQAGLADSDAG